jgi:hypothetical protein
MEADAIILERAIGVLDRRFYAQVLMDPTAHATREMLRIGAAQLRRDARSGLLPEPGQQRDPGPGEQRRARVHPDLGPQAGREDPAVREP